MRTSWSKGQTKYTNLSVKKISDTMKSRKLDNFKTWREKMKKEGKIKSTYPALRKNGDLAELIGVTLGDGHICVYPRTEEIRIISNASNSGFIKRYQTILRSVFNKEPYVIPSGQSKSVKIGLYEKHISSRMQIQSGARGELAIIVPNWIRKSKLYTRRYLRGLYEAEGSLCVHLPTSTHKFLFSNKNVSMLRNVYQLMLDLGFHPHWTKKNHMIQISRKEEVERAVKLLRFRVY